MKQHEITGIGSKREDGSCFIFTRLPQPFEVSGQWLADQTKVPTIGDIIEVDDAGILTLVDAAPKTDDTEITASPESEKKSLGLDATGEDKEPKVFKAYLAKPVTVHAAEITEVGEPNSDGSLFVHLADGTEKVVEPEMLKHISPVAGDYWVIGHIDNESEEFAVSKAFFEENVTLTTV